MDDGAGRGGEWGTFNTKNAMKTYIHEGQIRVAIRAHRHVHKFMFLKKKNRVWLKIQLDLMESHLPEGKSLVEKRHPGSG